jgi:VanZ family protein
MHAEHCEHAARPAMLSALMRWSERAARVGVLAAWMALISYWSGQGNLPIDQPVVASLLFGFQHRIAHLLTFGLLGLMAYWALAGVPRAAVWAVLLTSAFGATDEWHQSFTPGRHAGIDDFAWDAACAAIALAAWTRVRTTRWRAYVRAAAPLAVGAAFVIGIGLAVRPGVSLSSDVNRPTLGSIATEVAHGAIQVARTTRNVARQFRSRVAG